ncbi:hypothetical protein [Amycolatopsis taiwanensis]|uniref:Uncharacterized protein n=1 Tax=Amycolatopsis taiwanensis TaxID=342230 RepID=A0A9W6VHQ1_9PSEU|nr:hypothetical protein [Amycolatopsis taiwanensis]GLY66681.1 hypothetical protein Atai01_33000 [Amycolatopsis taiwanensis]
MTRRHRFHLGAWITPALLAVELVLVWSGLLSIGRAILLAIVVEVALAITALGRGIIAVRRFRAGRAAGQSGWAAAEDGLAQMLPRPVARALLIEVRLWVCLLRWITRRHDGRSTNAYTYGRNLRLMLFALLSLSVLEGAVVEVVLGVLLPGTPWPWVVLGLHAYALVWIAGLATSLHTRPHLLEDGQLRLRDSVFAEITIPVSAIIGARPVRRPGPLRSGLRSDPSDGTGTLAYGETTIALALDPDQPLYTEGRPAITGLTVLHITADDPGRLLDDLREAQAELGCTPGTRL